jgi:hypothetical protein
MVRSGPLNVLPGKMNWAFSGIAEAHRIGRRTQGREKLHAEGPNFAVRLSKYIKAVSKLPTGCMNFTPTTTTASPLAVGLGCRSNRLSALFVRSEFSDNQPTAPSRSLSVGTPRCGRVLRRWPWGHASNCPSLDARYPFARASTSLMNSP